MVGVTSNQHSKQCTEHQHSSTMGIPKWFKEVFPSVKTNKIKLDKLAGKRIGVDVSIWLHIISSGSDEYALRHSIKPLYPPTGYLDAFKHRMLTRIKLYQLMCLMVLIT